MANAPENWYVFKWDCEMHVYDISNIGYMGGHRETCKRKPKRKVEDLDNLRCHWSCCPKLKGTSQATRKGE